MKEFKFLVIALFLAFSIDVSAESVSSWNNADTKHLVSTVNNDKDDSDDKDKDIEN